MEETVIISCDTATRAMSIIHTMRQADYMLKSEQVVDSKVLLEFTPKKSEGYR